jgi:hypothetical protein
MKTKFFFAFLFFVCCSGTIFGQANWLWAKSTTSGGQTFYGEGWSVCTDTAGNVFETGFFHGGYITFGSITLLNFGASDIFIAKYDPNGNVLWAKSAGGGNGSDNRASSICADINGNIFITGSFTGSSITFGTITVNSAGANDIFIAKYDANGSVLWAKSEGGTNNDQGNSVKADSNGNVFLTGSFFSSTMTIGATTMTNAGSQDIFIAKYDANGNALWAKREGGTGDDIGNSVSVDANDNIFLTGYFGSPTITIGTTLLNNNSNNTYGDIFVAKYDSSGNVLWAKSSGGTNDDWGNSIVTDMNGNVFITGYFTSSPITFGTITLTNSGNEDQFISKYDGAGNVLWAKSAGGSDKDFSYSVNTDIIGNVFMTGGFYSPAIIFGSDTITNPYYPAGDPMFIVKYDANGNVLCASSLASGGDDQNSVSVDRFGNAYIGGDFMANSFVVGSDTLTLTGGEDVFLAKYNCTIGDGVNQFSNEKFISIFPNPSYGNFTIKNNFNENFELEVFNSLGKKVIGDLRMANSESTVDLSDQPNGIYFVRIISPKGQADEKIYSQKIVKE